jgi:hypothetical protein
VALTGTYAIGKEGLLKENAHVIRAILAVALRKFFFVGVSFVQLCDPRTIYQDQGTGPFINR